MALFFLVYLPSTGLLSCSILSELSTCSLSRIFDAPLASRLNIKLGLESKTPVLVSFNTSSYRFRLWT